MSRYDGLIIPRSYSEYINKTDAATLQQALQLANILAREVTAEDNRAITSGAVYSSLAEKQNLLTFDTTPTTGSTNPVTSGGVKSALTKANVGLGNVTNVATESTITSGSEKNITSGAVYSAIANRGRFYTVNCSTTSGTQKKEISINNYTLVEGDIIGVTFTNANTYGDSTTSTKTYPQLYINRGSLYYTMTICDSRGNSCGTGCWNAGDYIEFRVISSTKVCIINSNVRQMSKVQNGGYIIYSNGFTKYFIEIEYISNTQIKVRTPKSIILNIDGRNDDGAYSLITQTAVVKGETIISTYQSRPISEYTRIEVTVSFNNTTYSNESKNSYFDSTNKKIAVCVQGFFN